MVQHRYSTAADESWLPKRLLSYEEHESSGQLCEGPCGLICL